MSKNKTIDLPAGLFAQLEAALESSAFHSVDDLVLFILQNYLDQNLSAGKAITPDEEEVVRQRLRNLGYL